jgi:hypothetical protein
MEEDEKRDSVEGEQSDNYEWSMIPKNASEENKTGMTFKGNDEESYLILSLLCKTTTYDLLIT